MESQEIWTYKDRFENLFRVSKKVTSCLNIGDILEIIRDEVKVTVPHAREACLLLVDPDAPSYTRPLHCAVKKEQINCHMCKRGKDAIQKALGGTLAFECAFHEDASSAAIRNISNEPICELALPIFDGTTPLAVLNVVSEEGHILDNRDFVLLQDLAELATNTIINAKQHTKMAQEKLSLERILGHIGTFVPQTVRRIIEKNPEAPALNKQELDVSVLFLDVANYTRISELLTQDKVNFIIEKYFSSFLDIIYSNQGDINETAGDGLMAIFTGDATENALKASNAALEIRRRTADINKELDGMFYPIVVNMGINSGTAFLGMSQFIGNAGTRTTFTASGSTTNLASRLASAATEGDILVGPETARRVRDQILLFDRGLMSFKNIHEKVRVFSLVPLA